jgi:hypothetical protein
MRFTKTFATERKAVGVCVSDDTVRFKSGNSALSNPESGLGSHWEAAAQLRSRMVLDLWKGDLHER